MKDRSSIDIINPTLIAVTATAIHHRLSGWTTAVFRVPPEIFPGGGAQCKCDTIDINDRVDNVCTDIFHRLDVDVRSSTPEVQAKMMDTISSMICRRIHSTGKDPAMAQHHNNQGRIDEHFLDYVPEEQTEQPNNSCNSLSSFVAGTVAWMQFSAVLPMGRPAIASSSQPISCSDSNNNNNITNITSIANTGLVDGSTIVEGAMPLGG